MVSDVTPKGTRKGKRGVSKSGPKRIEGNGKGNGAAAEDDPGFTAGDDNPNISDDSDLKSKRVRRPKQEPLIDVGPIVHPAVQAAAEDYVETLDQRMALQQLEPDKRDYLIKMMQKHECSSCVVNGKTVKLEHLYKIVTKKNKEEE